MAFSRIFGEKCARCGARTKRAVDDVPTCDGCERKLAMEREVHRPCPACAVDMEKVLVRNVIVDRCAQCGGAWLDGGELEVLTAAIRDQGDFATGFVLGMVTG